jgi:predicted AlkP superfamily pyrophosphatase or phosphodiesterase
VTPRIRGAHRYRTLLIALSLVLGACTSASHAVTGPTLMEMARALGEDVVRTLARGHVPGRSGEIVLVPKPWNVLAQWTGGVRGPNDPRTTHSSPWNYHQHVPIALYGPGYVRPGVRVDRPVDLTDIAPTLAELLDFRFDAPHGRVLREALVPTARRAQPPRAIVVVVVDGGGWNVLEQWPDAWRFQRRIMHAGTTFTNATIGSSPSVTAPIHATIGTGAFPSAHGIAENTCRLPDGSVGDIALERGELSLMRRETLADAWDRATGERAWVGMLGYESWHLGMMGQGALAGGDRDVAVLWDNETETFTTNGDLYTLPSYLPGRDALDERLHDLDASDGQLDGTWNGASLDDTSYQFTANPAFAEFTGDAVLEIASREPLGRDRVTDLLFVELKTSDVAGHVWNMLSEEVETVLEVQDRILRGLVETLDRRVGMGRYVLAMTADHGQTPTPEAVGGLRIDRYALMQDLDGEFGGIVEALHPSDLFLAGDAEVSLEEVARFIGDYRYRDALPLGMSAGVPGDLLDERVFAAALPGSFLEQLSPEEVAELGPGSYPEAGIVPAA